MPDPTPEHHDRESTPERPEETHDPAAYPPAWRALCAILGTTNPAEVLAHVRTWHRLAGLADDASADAEARPAQGMVAINEVENIIREMYGRVDELRRRNAFLVQQLSGTGDSGVEQAFRTLYEETSQMYEVLQATTTKEAVSRIRGMQAQLDRFYAEKEALLGAGVSGVGEAVETIQTLRTRLASSENTHESEDDSSTRAEMNTLQAAYDTLREEHKATQHALTEAHQAQQDIQNELRVVRSVLESSRNQASLLQRRLAECADELILARAKQESLQEEVDISDEALALAEAELDEARTDARYALQDLEALKQEIEALRREVQHTHVTRTEDAQHEMEDEAPEDEAPPATEEPDADDSDAGNIVPLPSMTKLTQPGPSRSPDRARPGRAGDNDDPDQASDPILHPAASRTDFRDTGARMYPAAREHDRQSSYTTQELQAGLALEEASRSGDVKPYFRVIGTPPFASPEILSRLDKLSESALDQLSFGVFRLSDDGEVQYANRSGLRVLAADSVALDEVRGQNFFSDLAPDTAGGRFHERFQEGVRQRGIDAVFPYAFVGPDDAPRKQVVHLYRSPNASSNWILLKPMAS